MPRQILNSIKRFLPTFFVVVLIPLFANATNSTEGCASHDLNSSADSPLRKIPVYYQGSAGLCYAFVASQLIDFYRLKHNDSSYHLTNPIYAAWLAYFEMPKFFKAERLDGGEPEIVISALKKHGVCDEAAVSKALSSLGVGYDERNPTLLIGLLESAYEESGSYLSFLHRGAIEDFNRREGHLNCHQIQNLQIALAAKGLQKIAMTAVLQRLFAGCALKSVNIPQPQTKKFLIHTPVTNLLGLAQDEPKSRIIDSQLQGGMPTVIGFCENVLFDKTYRSGGLSSESCSPHAAMVVGQMKIGGKCHYLIRDTKGPLAKPWSSPNCACMTSSGQYKGICEQAESVKNLGCWVDKESVIANVDMTTTLSSH